MDKYTGAGFSKSGTVGKIFGYGSPTLAADEARDYAVVDLETSGGSASTGRIIEIAIVTMSAQGHVVEEYSTLVNPEDGNAGATFIHHISPKMLEGAPTFSEIAEDIFTRLAGNVVVAHNAAFEENFLAMEMARLNLPNRIFRAIDTLQLFARHIELPNYKLGTVLAEMGISEDAHTALGDTRGLAAAFTSFIPNARELGFPSEPGEKTLSATNPKVWQRVTNLRKGDEGWMVNLLRKMPLSNFVNEPFEKTLYFELLSNVLADKKITGDEIKQIAVFAGHAGMSRDYLLGLNAEFFAMAKWAAEQDGVVSEEESEHLEACRRLLAL